MSSAAATAETRSYRLAYISSTASEGSDVFLLFMIPGDEPVWSPGVEAQAVDCLYRLGKAYEVHVDWYFVEGTLEMNIHQVQRQKGELAVYVLSEPIVKCMNSLTEGWILHFLGVSSRK
ncbi:uncharacterized protein VP01_3876g3 [Puccinia sorghi]|uniref:Uncharacterized protein n=1 Tax=Puccinia sorghi TaxID=27349 RepID=A0A0L6USW5_9BASI|nr:uncharacterized protein VP01_3876g3 [Puccinia sorghi]